jgi:transposase-like protein
MGRRANAALALIWKRRVVEQRRSPLSIAEFCSQAGVSPKSFYVWRKRLRAVAADKPTRRASTPRRKQASAQERSRSHSRLFVPVHLPPASAPLGGLRIELPSGAVLTLPADASAELVTTAIQTVMSNACSAEPPSC